MVNNLAVGVRNVTWSEVGDPSGAPVFYLHGAGSSRLEIDRLGPAAAAAGLRLIGVDRPGYAGTSPLPMKAPGDMAGDVAALADSLGIDTFTVSGLSAGGMHALAVAAALGDRVSRAVTINGAPPLADPVIGPAAPKKLRTVGKLAARFPRVMVILIGKATGGGDDDPVKTVARMRKQSAADADMFEADPESLRLTMAASREGQQQGLAATVRDFALAASDWGFDVRSLACEVIVVSGTADPLRAAGQTLANEVGQAEFVSIPGGHVSVFNAEVLTTLADVMAHGVHAA